MNKQIESAWLELLEVCRNSPSVDDTKDIERAFEFAYQALGENAWPTGEIILAHSIEVARVVAQEVGLGVSSVVAGLLHNLTYEKVSKSPSLHEIETRFGPVVSGILEGMAKINALGTDTADIHSERLSPACCTISLTKK